MVRLVTPVRPRRVGRIVRRGGAIGATALLLANTLLSLLPAPVAAATTPTPTGRPTGPVSQASDTPLVTKVPAAPITPPQTGGSANPLANDPSIGRTPTSARYKPPSATTDVTADRTEHSRVLANKDGTFTEQFSPARLNYQDPQGAWQPVDLSLVPDKSTSEYDLRVKGLDRTVLLSDQSPNVALASISTPDQSGTLRSLDPSATVAATVTDGTLAFPTAGSSSELITLQPTDTGFAFGATLSDSTANPTIEFAFTSGGLTPQVEADGATIDLVESSPGPNGPTTTIVGQIDAPSLSDAASEQGPVTVVLSATDSRLKPGEYLLAYSIDPAWLLDSTRTFPVTLDPTYCLGLGASGCTLNNAFSGNYDSFIGSGADLHNTYPVGWKTTRIGVDGRNSDCAGPTNCAFGTMRGLYQFAHVSLPDGANVTSAAVTFRVNSVFGTGGQGVKADLMTEGWSQTSTWDQLTSPVGWTSTDASPVVTVPVAGHTFDVDITTMLRDWFIRNPKGWRANFGFMLKMDTEASPNEVMLDNGAATTAANRPLLTITYVVPQPQFSFDPALGPTYAPSSMVAGQTVILPISIQNAGSGFTFNHTVGSDYYLAGYRWFDSKGNIVTGTYTPVVLPADIASGATSALFPLSVVAPTGTGSYTLRLDLVHRVGAVNLYASDWATPSLYYSRNKRVLTSDSTRWTGSSVVERDEFSIDVVTGGGTNIGDTKSVTTGDGGTIGINLDSKNLTYANTTGLGFSDLVPVGLTYGYNSADATACGNSSPSLQAAGVAPCGWYTNYDERLTAGATDGAFTYQDSAGNRYLVDTDDDGQMISGAPVLLSRVRATLYDDNKPTFAGPSLVTPSFGAYSGSYAISALSKTSTNVGTATPAGDGNVSLNAFRMADFAVRTDSAASAGIDFYIFDKTTATYRWFIYTVGPNWTTGFDQVALGGTINGSSWVTYSDDLYSRIVANSSFGAPTDDYYVHQVNIQSSSGANLGNTYVDAWRLEAKTQTSIVDAVPTWTAAGSGSSTTSTDAAVGADSVDIQSEPAANSPTCKNTSSCFPTGFNLNSYAFAHWWWKKVGGSTVAMTFTFKDTRSGAPCSTSPYCTLTYYAGPGAPAGTGTDCDSTPTSCAIQVSPTLPTSWTKVTRNILEDARTVLGFYDDANSASPDPVEVEGYSPSGGDGDFGLFDDLAFTTVPDVGATDRWGNSGEYGHPNTTGDSTFTYDFKAEYSDGTTHYFNRDGLLIRVTNRDGKYEQVVWTYNTTALTPIGQAAYALQTVIAPGDGLATSASTAKRRLDVTTSAPSGFNAVTFSEYLGTTSTDSSTRSAVFYVATATGTTYGIGDVVKVSPAANSVSGSCGTHPSGCVEFNYVDTTSHRLFQVSDPRWTGATSGSADLRYEIDPNSSAAPTSIVDRSHSSTALLTVLSWSHDTDSAPLYARPLYQDAAAGATNSAIYEDLTPDGSIAATYVPIACSSGNCTSSANWPAGTTSTLASQILQRSGFDGLARVSTTTSYRTTGSTPQVTISRQGTNAGAKVDNYNDPLAGAEIAWTQTADQEFASLRDSAGLNPDLYRTTYAYNGFGQPLDTVTEATNQNPEYADAITSTYFIKGYWRLNETSGTTVLDSSGNGYNGTYTGTPTLNQPGSLVNDPSNHAVTLNGTSQYATIPGTALGLINTSFTVEAWASVADTSHYYTIVGTRGPGSSYGFDMKFSPTGTIHSDIGSGTAWLSTSADATFAYQANHWYHIVETVGAGAYAIYVDGNEVGSGSYAGTALLTDSTHSVYIGQYGGGGEYLKGSVDEVAIYTDALDPSRVVAHTLAGRAIAAEHHTPQYDAKGHPVISDDDFLTNGGFESGLIGWQNGGGAAPYFSTGPFDPNVRQPSYVSLNVTTTSYVNQDAQLLPGQTFRVQFWHKSAAAGVTATFSFYYWNTTTHAWGSFFSASSTATSWTSEAWDAIVPMNSDGRVRLSFWNSGGTGTAYFDDSTIVTNWGTAAYNGNGLVTDSTTLNVVGPGGGTNSLPVLDTNTAFDPGTTYPGIFPTGVTANYVAAGGATSDQNVLAKTAYDSWGRPIQTTDPDGLTSPLLSYSPSGNQTDEDQSTDALGNVTRWTYDSNGNALTVTSPMGETSTSTYDLAGNDITVTAPDSVEHVNTYNNWGQLQYAIDNELATGTPSGVAGTDNLITTYAYDLFGHRVQSDVDSSGGTTFSGGLDARTKSTFDDLGALVKSSTYDQFVGAGTPRDTIDHFATTPTTTALGVSVLATPSETTGVEAPIAPSSSPAPACPDAVRFCNSVATVDANGLTLATVDAYGHPTTVLYNLASEPVQVTQASDPGTSGHGTGNDRNLVTTSTYDLAGRPSAVTDPAGRKTLTGYDNLGRATVVTHDDSTGTAISDQKTVYLPSGRVDRVSSTETNGTADNARTWTKSVYDSLGRAVTTLDHADISGAAGLQVESFEDRRALSGSSPTWSGAALGSAIAAGSTATLDTPYAVVAPHSGTARLDVATTGTANQGVAWTLEGTYTNGQTYDAGTWIQAASGTYQVAFADASGTVFGAGSATAVSGSTWTWLASADWTVSGGDKTGMRLIIRQTAGSATTFYVDDVQDWNKATPDSDVPASTSIYDADGRIIESVLPPKSVSTSSATAGSPEVNTVAYDSVGQQVAIDVDAANSYDAVVAGTGALVAEYPLDERSGTTATDRKSGLSLTYASGSLRLSPSSVDQASTGIAFDGSSQAATRGSADLSATDNYSLEAWFRLDASPASGVAPIVENGTDSAGYGLGINASGHLVGTTNATANDSGVTITVGTWHEAALVRTSGTSQLYLDGAAVGSSWSTAPSAPGTYFGIGASSGLIHFAGVIDDVAAYSAALSSGTIAAHFAAGRPVSVATSLVTRTSFDPLRRSVDAWGPNNPSSTYPTPNLPRTHYVYDRLSHLQSTTLDYVPGGTTTVNGDVNVTSTFASDALGELLGYCPAVQVYLTGCDPTSSSAAQAWHYAYDAMGRVSTQTPPVNVSAVPLDITTWSYDTGGRLSSLVSKQAGGTVDRHTDPTAYDWVGRPIISTTYAGSGTGTTKLKTTTAFNVDGSVASIAFDGTGSSEGTDTITNIYDNLGRLLQVKRGSTVLTAYAWNGDGTLASRTDGTLGTTTFVYDWAKRELTTSPPSAFGAGASVTTTYNLDGTLATRQWPSGEIVAAGYDAAKRPTSLAYSDAGTLTESYDRAGNVTSEGRALTGVTGDTGTGTQSFTYDQLKRVTGSSGLSSASNRSYVYDLDGNRASKTEGGVATTFVADRTDELVSETSGTTTTFTFDHFGNLTSKGENSLTATAYSYDLGDRLTSIAPASGSAASFTFDALGRLASRVIGTTTDTYGYVGGGTAVFEVATTGGTTITTDSAISQGGIRLGTKSGSALGWILYDLHGNIVGDGSASGSILDAFRFDACGELVGTPVLSSLVTPWRFQGRLNVSPGGSSELYTFGARFYAPSLDGFTQADTSMGTSADPLSLNRYLYAEGNPSTLLDLNGHECAEIVSAAAPAAQCGPGNSQPPPPPECNGKCKDDKTPPTTTCTRACIDDTAPPAQTVVTPVKAPVVPVYHVVYGSYIVTPQGTLALKSQYLEVQTWGGCAYAAGRQDVAALCAAFGRTELAVRAHGDSIFINPATIYVLNPSNNIASAASLDLSQIDSELKKDGADLIITTGISLSGQFIKNAGPDRIVVFAVVTDSFTWLESFDIPPAGVAEAADFQGTLEGLEKFSTVGFAALDELANSKGRSWIEVLVRTGAHAALVDWASGTAGDLAGGACGVETGGLGSALCAGAASTGAGALGNFAYETFFK